jgi:hypothetical protein
MVVACGMHIAHADEPAVIFHAGRSQYDRTAMIFVDLA